VTFANNLAKGLVAQRELLLSLPFGFLVFWETILHVILNNCLLA
jgi:hypothetical protein